MKNEPVSRFSVSLPPSLLRQFDEMSSEKGYDNRSLAIGDMMRDRLVEHRQKFGNEDIAAPSHWSMTTTNSMFRPRSPIFSMNHHEVIVSTVHVHLDHDNCLEVLVVRGKAPSSRRLPMN